MSVSDSVNRKTLGKNSLLGINTGSAHSAGPGALRPTNGLRVRVFGTAARRFGLRVRVFGSTFGSFWVIGGRVHILGSFWAIFGERVHIFGSFLGKGLHF